MTEEDEEAQRKAQAAEDRGRTRACVGVEGQLGAIDRRRGVFDVHLVSADASGRRLYFECSMLQTREERSDGTVRWRDMSCDEAKDPDDFEALWRKARAISDFAEQPQDDVLAVPPERPVGWLPKDMIAAYSASGNRVLVEHGRAAGPK